MHDKKPITADSSTTFSVVASAVGLAMLGTVAWANLRAEVKAIGKDSVTTQQSQEWIDNFRERNPNVVVPRLPDKKSASTKIASPVEAVLNERRNLARK